MGVAGLALSRWEQVRGAELPAVPAVSPLPGSVLILDLGGTAWTLQQVGQSEKLSAQVPGDHYSDLLRAGKIPDPYYRDNNKAVQWAAQTGWIYQRTFEATPEQLAMGTVELVCHGLDTLATVTLNGTLLGSTNNMFRTWVYDVKQALKAGTNDPRNPISTGPRSSGNECLVGGLPERAPERSSGRRQTTIKRARFHAQPELGLDPQSAVPMGLGLVPSDSDDGHLEGHRTARL